jgi:hypothetical protein
VPKYEFPIQAVAADYISRGWAVVPLAPNTKVAPGKGWETLVFQPEDFREQDNIGIKSVHGLVVVDIDCLEAVSCADSFLPETGAVFGRKSKPRSKRIYRADFSKIIALKDLDPDLNGKECTLIEIRVNHQDMAPPSVHPLGEVVQWETGEPGQPSEVEPALLLRAVRLVATASLVGRYYNPEGNRHEWCLALAGTFRGLGLTEAEAISVVKAAGHLASDAKLDDRIVEIRATYAHSDDEPVTGAKTLKELSRRSPAFVKSLGKLWGASGGGQWILDAKGERILPNSQENIKRALDRLKVVLSFDAFSQKAMVEYGSYKGALEDTVVTRIWLEIDKQYHFRASKDFFFDVVQDTAHAHTFHPVLNYLKAQTWDGTPRVDEWLIRSGKAADTPYVRAVSALMLIAAVRRITRPGCKFDEMLVLESGEQGLFKSTALRTLCPNDSWFSDDLPLNVEAKQIVERTLGKWIIEASDLSGMPKSQVEHLKAMLSRQVDGPVRLAYARIAVEQRRQFIIVGTTNSYHYLSDQTGNRRFWPVRIEKFDIPWLKANRDQLWAEAVHRETLGESIRLAPHLYKDAAFQQERRRTGDPWELTLEGHFTEPFQRIANDELWELLGIAIERRDDRGQLRVIKIMQMLGFRRMTVKDRKGKTVKGWGRSSKLIEPFTEDGRWAPEEL